MNGRAAIFPLYLSKGFVVTAHVATFSSVHGSTRKNVARLDRSESAVANIMTQYSTLTTSRDLCYHLSVALKTARAELAAPNANTVSRALFYLTFSPESSFFRFGLGSNLGPDESNNYHHFQ